MDVKGFVDRAKGAAVAAADKAKEVAAVAAEQAKAAMAGAPAQETEGGLISSEPGVAGASQAKGAFATTKLAELTALGAERIQDLLSSFQQALPAIKTAGYELTEFEIELGVTPKLIPHFRHTARTPEDIEAARERLRENRLGAVMLGALLKAGDVHRQIKVAGFSFSHIEIELGLLPSIRVQYKRE